MRSTFNLKEPKKEKGKTLILFSAYFKNEGKKFVYSTGEYISPDDWDFDLRQPANLTGRKEKTKALKSINTQIKRYSSFFDELVASYKLSERELIISNIKDDFDNKFKRTKAISNKFFHVYELFLESKRNDFTDDANSPTTIKRYEYNKQHLIDFQESRGKKIHFNQITKSFYNDFIKYCVFEKKHSANTLKRNMGMFKTFLYWAFDEGHTYKLDFQKFKMPKGHDTDEVALSYEQVQEVLLHDLSKNKRLERVRDLFVFGCTTGMRISNYGKIKKRDIEEGFIKVVEVKDNSKYLKIPLNEISTFILEKYEYNLPSISTQKFNEYIKDVFELLGYTAEVKKTLKIGNEVIEKQIPFYERISSHTARRSFITIMKNKKVPDKIIMSYTGHKDLKNFNKYYKPNDDDRKEFMQDVWKLEKTPLKIAK